MSNPSILQREIEPGPTPTDPASVLFAAAVELEGVARTVRCDSETQIGYQAGILRAAGILRNRAARTSKG